MVREWEFALVHRFQEGGFAATIFSEETVSAAKVHFYGAVVEENFAVEHQTRGRNLDVAALRHARQHTGCDSIADPVLVFLEGQLLDCFRGLHLVRVQHRRLIVAVD